MKISDNFLSRITYSEVDGKFYSKKYPQLEIGWVNDGGYKILTIDGKDYRAHRLVWAIHNKDNPYPIEDIDHIDGDKLNNKISNLRLATRRENMQNIKKANANNKSGYLGVSSSGIKSKPWRATITNNGKSILIGYFNDPEEAHYAYLNTKRIIHEFCTI